MSPLRRRLWKPLPFLEVGVDVDERLDTTPDFASHDSPSPTKTGRLAAARDLVMAFRGLLLGIPLIAVFIVGLVGLLVFDWSYRSDPWPTWFVALVVLAVACVLLDLYLNRRDRVGR